MDGLRHLLVNAPMAAALFGLLAGIAAFFALGLHSRKRLELRSATAWANSIKWRDFLRMAVSVLRTRGLELDPTERQPGDDGFDLLMQRGSSRYIVVCKHGRAYQLNAKAINNLSTVMKLQGAEGAIIVTTGSADAAARAVADAQRVELIDGKTLWNLLRPQLGEPELKSIAKNAERARNRRLAGMCGIALLAGVAGFALSRALETAAVPAASQQAADTSSQPAREPASTSTEGTQANPGSAPGSSPPALMAPEDAPTSEAQIQASREAALALEQISQMSEEQLEGRRQEAAKLAATVRGIETAEWSTKSTLVLRLLSERLEEPDAVTSETCELLVRFEELRYTRLQLEPAGAQETPRIRWRQCR